MWGGGAGHNGDATAIGTALAPDLEVKGPRAAL
jgi:hypothetical protein